MPPKMSYLPIPDKGENAVWNIGENTIICWCFTLIAENKNTISLKTLKQIRL